MGKLTGVFGNDHRSLSNVGQAGQSDFGQVRVVVHHERQSGKMRAVHAPDDHQVREQFAQAGQTGDPVYDQVLGDLTQQRETGLEVRGLSGVQQHDLYVAVDHGAVVQRGQPVAGVPDDHAAAYLFLAGRGRGDQQRPQPNERGQPDGDVHERRKHGALHFICCTGYTG